MFWVRLNPGHPRASPSQKRATATPGVNEAGLSRREGSIDRGIGHELADPVEDCPTAYSSWADVAAVARISRIGLARTARIARASVTSPEANNSCRAPPH